jgi:hypothetical protein
MVVPSKEMESSRCILEEEEKTPLGYAEFEAQKRSMD